MGKQNTKLLRDYFDKVDAPKGWLAFDEAKPALIEYFTTLFRANPDPDSALQTALDTLEPHMAALACRGIIIGSEKFTEAEKALATSKWKNLVERGLGNQLPSWECPKDYWGSIRGQHDRELAQPIRKLFWAYRECRGARYDGSLFDPDTKKWAAGKITQHARAIYDALARDTDGRYTPDYSEILKEIFDQHPSPQSALALLHFETVDGDGWWRDDVKKIAKMFPGNNEIETAVALIKEQVKERVKGRATAVPQNIAQLNCFAYPPPPTGRPSRTGSPHRKLTPIFDAVMPGSREAIEIRIERTRPDGKRRVKAELRWKEHIENRLSSDDPRSKEWGIVGCVAGALRLAKTSPPLLIWSAQRMLQLGNLFQIIEEGEQAALKDALEAVAREKEEFVSLYGPDLSDWQKKHLEDQKSAAIYICDSRTESNKEFVTQYLSLIADSLSENPELRPLGDQIATRILDMFEQAGVIYWYALTKITEIRPGTPVAERAEKMMDKALFSDPEDDLKNHPELIIASP